VRADFFKVISGNMIFFVSMRMWWTVACFCFAA
jgi:hypothetical protein